MTIEEILKNLELKENKHYAIEKREIPVIDSHLYTPLGKQLFDLYQKYKISREDQRQFETLCFLLSAFVIQKKPDSVWKKLKSRIWN